MREFRKYNLANTISAQRRVPYIIYKSILKNRLLSNKAIYIYIYIYIYIATSFQGILEPYMVIS